MRTVTEPVQLALGDLRKIFIPGDEVPDEWPIPDEYLAGGRKGKSRKAEPEADTDPVEDAPDADPEPAPEAEPEAGAKGGKR